MIFCKAESQRDAVYCMGERGLSCLNRPKPCQAETVRLCALQLPRLWQHVIATLIVQINLKRKHWDSSGEQGRSSKRCTDIYERQMSEASGKKARGSSSLRQPAPRQGASSRGAAGTPGSEAVQRLRAQQAAHAQKLAQVTVYCCCSSCQHI